MIRRFEDLLVWQKANMFCEKIFELTCREGFAEDVKLKYQINGSSGSIMDNIAEGFERDGKNEFLLFLSYAKGSAGESRSQLYRAFSRKYLTESEFIELKTEIMDISKMLAGLIKQRRENSDPGLRYRSKR